MIDVLWASKRQIPELFEKFRGKISEMWHMAENGGKKHPFGLKDELITI